MSLMLLRVVDLLAICLAAGFLGAAALEASKYMKLPRYIHALGVSYTLFALGSAVQIEHAMRAGEPATWRTAIVTTAAGAGVTSCVWAYFDIRRMARQSGASPSAPK